MTIKEKIEETIMAVVLGAAICGAYATLSWLIPVVVVNKVLANAYYHNAFAYIAIGLIIINWIIAGVVYVTFLGYELKEIW